MDVSTWLRDLGLENYVQAFRANHIDAEVLARLTAEDLVTMGVTSVGHRRKLLDAIAVLQGGGTALASAQPSAATTRPVQAERRQLTVMFVDLVGSTALASRLDPEDMGDVIRAYQDACAGEITRLEGHIAKFMGDGVLAYFGWLRAHEDEPERAVRAALAVAKVVGDLREPGFGRLAVRIGIATGPVGNSTGRAPGQIFAFGSAPRPRRGAALKKIEAAGIQPMTEGSVAGRPSKPSGSAPDRRRTEGFNRGAGEAVRPVRRRRGRAWSTFRCRSSWRSPAKTGA